MNPDHHNNFIDLFDALASLGSKEEARKFMIDLCTPSEINAFMERWKVCQLLNCKKYSYREIKEILGASLTTIGRVARFLNDEPYQGYKNLLDKIQKQEEKR